MSRTDPLAPLALNLAGGATEIHLVRHAHAVPDEHVRGHHYDDYDRHPLSEHGRAQADAVAEHFAALKLAAVYASPIRRARETADAIAARAGHAVVEDGALREVEIGAFEGEMTMRERLDALAVIAIRDGSWDAVPGTEASAIVRARMTRAIDAIAARHRGGRVAVVSHAGSINAFLGAVAGTAHDFLFPLANASVTVVRVNSDRKLLMTANETAHLRAAKVRA
ncbi:MAG: histidine phosphatase family protein [Candidatus Eremiobacteraeota bacterium]|nr:histidine phosphatase family protein [Candidatus Eremiobacteraeota bacterium]